MPDSGENIRVQILVNGEVRGTAGMESVGVLSVILDWVRRDPPRFPGRPASILGFKRTTGSVTRFMSALVGLILRLASMSGGSGRTCRSVTKLSCGCCLRANLICPCTASALRRATEGRARRRQFAAEVSGSPASL
jgi:hypothetical protein